MIICDKASSDQITFSSENNLLFLNLIDLCKREMESIYLFSNVIPGSSAGSFLRKFFFGSFFGKQRSCRALCPNAVQQDSERFLLKRRLKAEATSVTKVNRSEALIWKRNGIKSFIKDNLDTNKTNPEPICDLLYNAFLNT